MLSGPYISNINSIPLFLSSLTNWTTKSNRLTDDNLPKKINLKGVNIPKDQIEAGMIYVKEVVEEKEKARLGEPTDLYSKDGKMFFLKLGRFGSYLESEDFANDEVRESLPTEIRKMLSTPALFVTVNV